MAMDKLLAKLDFIVSPATPISAFEVGPEVPGDIILDRGVNAGSFAFPINLSQQPAGSTPCGLTAAGLPIGIQFVGAGGADADVYRQRAISTARAGKVVRARIRSALCLVGFRPRQARFAARQANLTLLPG
jgi:Asp-tRNA(Asn)/Glu-tRNA(Gln) amidotransferase A subunit family amidase